MAWYWTFIIALIFFSGGLILGFWLCIKWLDPGDHITVRKAKAKRGGVLRLTNIFNKQKRRNHE